MLLSWMPVLDYLRVKDISLHRMEKLILRDTETL